MTVKVSPKFQVVIPLAIRTELGIKAGTEVQVVSKGNIIFLVPTRSLGEIGKKYGSRFAPADLKRIREKKDRKR